MQIKLLSTHKCKFGSKSLCMWLHFNFIDYGDYIKCKDLSKITSSCGTAQ